jgi:hypothetical protein
VVVAGPEGILVLEAMVQAQAALYPLQQMAPEAVELGVMVILVLGVAVEVV